MSFVRRLLLPWLALFLGLATCAHGTLESTDSAMTLQAARALWLRGDSGLQRSSEGAAWAAEGMVADHIAGRAAAGVQEYGKQGTSGRYYVWFPTGHVAAMVPAVAVGEWLGEAFPQPEQAYRAAKGEELYPHGMFVFDHLLACMLPAAFGAASVLLLVGIARALGAASRDAWTSALVVLAATQFFPLTRETLSDGPSVCWLLAALLVVVRAHAGLASAPLLLLGGACAGLAVLTRYQHGLLVPLFAIAVLCSRVGVRQWRSLVLFAAGGIPALVLLLAVNAARFGSPFDTGYPEASSWFNQPLWIGLFKLLFAGGKGMLWFTPVLWYALPAALGRRFTLRWLAWGALLVPLLMFSATPGWQSGQCWGARYVTPGITCFLALALPQLLPWRTRPVLTALLVGAGLLVNLTAVLAPTRGHNQLAGQAVRVHYQQRYERGEVTAQDVAALDPADRFFFEWRFSPLHSHWTYAALSARGAFEDDAGRPVADPARTIEPMFGVTSADPAAGLAPIHWEDRGFRHLWWVLWARLWGLPPALLLGSWLALVALVVWCCRIAGPRTRES